MQNIIDHTVELWFYVWKVHVCEIGGMIDNKTHKIIRQEKFLSSIQIVTLDRYL